MVDVGDLIRTIVIIPDIDIIDTGTCHGTDGGGTLLIGLAIGAVLGIILQCISVVVLRLQS